MPFCPTNIPANGVYLVGSMVELMWKGLDEELMQRRILQGSHVAREDGENEQES
jgi:hypothetical protein